MHLYFFLRGIYNRVELWKTFAQCQFWKWERQSLDICNCGQEKKNHKKTKNCKKFKGRTEIKLVQGALRPTLFGAYEYVFPEECLSEVISIFPMNEDYDRDFRIKFIRKIFGCEKIPLKNFEEAKKIPNTISINGSWRGLSNLKIEGVGVHIIGIKRDKRVEWDQVGYDQELL